MAPFATVRFGSLINMFPRQPFNDLKNNLHADSVFAGEFGLGSAALRIALSDIANIGFGQFSVSMLLSSRERLGVGATVVQFPLRWGRVAENMDRVANIFTPGAVFKVFNAVIVGISILVINLFTCWTWAMERSKDKVVNFKRFTLLILEQSQTRIARYAVICRGFNNVRTAANDTNIGHLVKPFITWDRSKFLLHVVSMSHLRHRYKF